DGKLRVNDIIIALNQTRIRNNDDLASYLAENTLPGQLLRITVVRGNSTIDVDVTLGRRPTPST
ncbi:MAG: PDZ domain-containing protein, partial [Candidatus Bathyarchaeia archaeon]